jgi:hypothetical protein
LSDIECQAIGSFSPIESDEYKWSKAQVKTTWSEALAYAQKNVKICQASLVSPSYDEIFALVGKRSFNESVRVEIKRINAMLEDMHPGPALKELEEIRDSLILAWDVILPDDFMAAVVVHALQIAKTDIKKVTEDMLYEAAILAERAHAAPHDYIHGVFSDFNTRDIDLRAWIVYETRQEELREELKQKREA